MGLKINSPQAVCNLSKSKSSVRLLKNICFNLVFVCFGLENAFIDVNHILLLRKLSKVEIGLKTVIPNS